MWHYSSDGKCISTGRAVSPDSTRQPPISVEQMMEHTHIKNPQRSEYASQCLKAAIMYFENATRLSINPYTVTYYVSEWPREDYLYLPYPPIVNVTSFQYRPKGSTFRDVPLPTYTFQSHTKPPRFHLVDDEDWPTDELSTPDGIRVVYTTGYTISNLPSDIMQAILMLSAHYYEHRESVVLGTITGVKSAGMAQSLESTINTHRIHVY